MPVPVIHELAARLPALQLYNCYGQSEIAPLATVLRPEEHAERPASAGGRSSVETRVVVDPDMRDLPPGEMGEIITAGAVADWLLGQARGNRRQLRRRLVPFRRRGLLRRGRLSVHHRPHQTSSRPAAWWLAGREWRSVQTPTRRWPRWQSSGLPDARAGSRPWWRWWRSSYGAAASAEELIAHVHERPRAVQGAPAGGLCRRPAAQCLGANCSARAARALQGRCAGLNGTPGAAQAAGSPVQWQGVMHIDRWANAGANGPVWRPGVLRHEARAFPETSHPRDGLWH